MAKSRYKFFEDVYNEDTKHTQKGFPKVILSELFSNDNDIIYTIPLEEVYRPDLITFRFYGNPKLYWILVYVNGISDSPEGFYEGRTIRVPQYERVIELV